MRNEKCEMRNEKNGDNSVLRTPNSEFVKRNPLLDKSKAFALRIIKLYKFLCRDRKEFIISKQLLRSGTSIGANVREAQRGQSKADFYAKLNISLKEADESAYWLELLHESDYLTDEQFESLITDCNELIALLVSITKQQKEAGRHDK